MPPISNNLALLANGGQPMQAPMQAPQTMPPQMQQAPQNYMRQRLMMNY